MNDSSTWPTIDAMLADVAAAHAQRTALVDGGGRCSYEELWRQVHRFARMLHEAGIRPGERVVLLMPTSIMHTIAVLGCMHAQALPCSRMRLDARSALSALSMNEMRCCSKRTPSNWVSRLWPMVSAVMPVPSDT